MNRFLIAVSLSSVLLASETRVSMHDLPAPVQNTVRQQTKTATLRGLTKETEHGKTYYEAETTMNGKSRDVLIDPAGAIVEVEEAVDIAAIPAAARSALEAQGKVVKLESVTRGSVVSYECVVQKGGKKHEVAVNADGTVGK